jgi:nicotinate dehydrogenase subunit A
MIDININDEVRKIDVELGTPLLYVLRGELGLSGAKFGCGSGQCGACTVVLDGEAIFSCLTPVSTIRDRKVKTIEGLGTIANPSPLQRAFIDLNAAQCGYCSAGMIMRAAALLEKHPAASETDIRAHMEPNLCRCGSHVRILAAIRKAASEMRARMLPNSARESAQ